MKTILGSLISDIYQGMISKLSLIWPKKNSCWPPEANLIFEIAKLGERYNYYSYGEANVGKRGRRDMFLLEKDKKWICQVEAKLVNVDTIKNNSVREDLNRVKDKDSMEYFIRFSKDDEILNSKRYGLFVGGDVLTPDVNSGHEALSHAASCLV